MEPKTTTVYLVRHGAASMDWSKGDAFRPLTPQGIQQAEAVGGLIARRGENPDVALTSTYRRAVETTERILLACGAECDVIQDEDFTPDSDPVVMLRRIAALAVEVVLVVGHLPSIEQLAERLAPGKHLPFTTGTVAAFSFNRIDKTATLTFFSGDAQQGQG